MINVKEQLIQPDTDQPSAKPFLKWAGGKTRLLLQYEPLFPEWTGTYFEPFAGSGAVFFYLYTKGRINQAHLADRNDELITCYQGVRDSLPQVVAFLERHRERHCEDYFYQVRGLEPGDLTFPERAARTIYLNKTCYNGLYRVNKKGKFNVPIGRYSDPPILDRSRLAEGSQALQGVSLRFEDFAELPNQVHQGDFVYLDPPYHPLSKTANFTSYTSGVFDEGEQRRLCRVFGELSDNGALVMLSNSDTGLVRELYQGFHIHVVRARRAINSKGGNRGEINELVITNYETT